jgi:hypothetical protein
MGAQVSQQTTNRYFDELASGLASGSISRGKALRLMGAALVGGTLGSLGIGEAAADDLCKPEGKKCRKDKQCCSGKCEGRTCAAGCVSDGGTCANGSECCSGKCKSSTCVASCIPPSAISCDPVNRESCPGGIVGGCVCVGEADSGVGYCSTAGSSMPCSTSCDCPAGQFCQPFGDGNLCAVAAEVCPVR